MKRKIAAAFATGLSVVLLASCGVKGMTGIADEETKAADTVSVAENEADSAVQKTEAKAEKKEEEEKVEEYRIGEAWTEDGLWSITMLGATLTDERNEYSDLAPGAVYVVDYAYSNLGYEDSILDGLYVSLDQEVIDSAGEKGYLYPGTIVDYPESAPVGATCKAQACIGVANPGTFTINMTIFDKAMKPHRAAFVIDPDSEKAEMALPNIEQPDVETYEIGETWVVDGQWAVAVTDVTETEDRNEFEDKNPAAVYIVGYDYKNDGYQDTYGEDTDDSSLNGLFITMDDQIVDSQGMMGYSYAGAIEHQPVIVSLGDSTHAQSCIGVEHPGDFRVSVILYDNKGDKHKGTFLIKVPPKDQEDGAPSE
ncbi:MAG: hypothetical protein Q4A32_02550 [Lachnospiraceae bacterium]|nr:hypothetical protein [Lachnospiraceae bacterium]